MKKVYNKIIPMKGFKALTVWPFIFIHSSYADRFNDIDTNHEEIHGNQQMEVLAISVMIVTILTLCLGISLWIYLLCPFIYFLWYTIEWLIRWGVYEDRDKAYESICFEQEAYQHEADFNYCVVRKHFAWLSYIRSSLFSL